MPFPESKQQSKDGIYNIGKGICGPYPGDEGFLL